MVIEIMKWNVYGKIGVVSALVIGGTIAGTSVFAKEKISQAEIEKFEMMANVDALMRRQKASFAGFEEFKKTIYKEPWEYGVYIVNGDTPISTDIELLDYFNGEIKADWKSTKFGVQLDSRIDKLTADAPDGYIVAWDNAKKRNLTYCVSTTFGSLHDSVVDAVKEATGAWEKASDVKFIYRPEFDSACTNQTYSVVFDVRPVDVNREYLARAFFPRYNRLQRSVLIDKSSFDLEPGNLTLTGILRHEFGHVLSFRHEHTRPEAGACFEDDRHIPLGDYDPFSVMHYPQCNGLGDWSLDLTKKDKKGAACIYGPGPETDAETSCS